MNKSPFFPPRLAGLVLLALCSFWTSVGIAQTYVSGPVSGTWKPAGSPYVVTDTLEVPAGQNLLIRPGVEVLFDGAYTLTVHGTLQAGGVLGDSITFAPLSPGSFWRGIRFLSAGDGSYLRFCRISDSEVEGDTNPTGCGGAIYSENTSLVVSHCRIENCSATSEGFIEGGGGAIYCYGGSPQITANRIVGCIAYATCTAGGGAISFRQADILIRDNEILDCHAHGLGGGIAGFDSQVDISHNVISECSGFHYGGGVGLRENCSGLLFDNLIVDNEAPDIRGGGIYLWESSVDVISCTVAFNSVGQDEFGRGGGLYVSEPLNPSVIDCIFWGNTAGEVGPQIWPDNMSNVSFCDVEGGYLGLGNFNTDPLFVSAAKNGNHSGYYLSAIAAGQGANSPCIDAGSCPATDAELDGRTTRVDLVTDADDVDLGFHHPVSIYTSVDDLANDLSRQATLEQNYPNPFNPQTTIRFYLPIERSVRLAVYNVSGQLVITLVNEIVPRGSHAVVWDGKDKKGGRVSSGAYFYRMEAGAFEQTKKLILLK